MEWKKFLTTEWIAFCALVALGFIAFMRFAESGKVDFWEWASFTVALAVNLGVVRTWQKGQQVGLEKLEKKG